MEEDSRVLNDFHILNVRITNDENAVALAFVRVEATPNNCKTFVRLEAKNGTRIFGAETK